MSVPGSASAKPDARQIKLLADSLQQHMALYGYQLIETPIIDRADLFLTKAGDRIAEQLFTFERNGHQWALRPEFTAAAAHLYNTEEILLHPVRWQYSGPIFSDTHVSGAQYQTYSAGAELIGQPGPTGEAEIISMAADGLLNHDIMNWRLIIGHVGLTRRLLERYSLDPRTQRFILHRRDLLIQDDGQQKLLEELSNYFPRISDTVTLDDSEQSESSTQRILDAMLNTSRSAETMGGRTRRDITRRLLRKRHQAAQQSQVEDALYFLKGWIEIRTNPQMAMDEIENYIGLDETAMEMFRDWSTVLDLLATYQVPQDNIIIQPDLARTWDYYTGLVFEIRTQGGLLLAGGGRYDDLTRLLGAEKTTPAVGFAYDIEQAQKALPRQTRRTSRLIRLVGNANDQTATIQWARMLRQRDVPIALVDFEPEGAIFISVNDDGNVHLGDRIYRPDEIEQLVTVLKGK